MPPRKAARQTDKTSSPQPTDSKPAAPLAIVGIGASAGGLTALQQIFGRFSDNTGLAFVVIVHLSPERKSHLPELLQKHTKLTVEQVTQTTALRPNRIYVIPPNANLEAIDTHLRLSPLEKERNQRAAIDRFFHTLAQTHDGDSIGIILSGTGSDGANGIKEIKQCGGITIVQDPNEAEYDGMPQSALSTGLVDLVLPIAHIPDAVVRVAKVQPQLLGTGSDEDLSEENQRLLQRLFALITARTNRDFVNYKGATLLRRVQRRMQLREKKLLSDYFDLLRSEPAEVDTLADDLCALRWIGQRFRVHGRAASP